MSKVIDGVCARERLEELGRTIRYFRGERTQAELGAALGVPQTTVSRWETGLVDLSVSRLRALEDALDLPLGTLAYVGGFVAGGLVGYTPEVFRESYFDCIEDAVEELRAAEALGLGVRLTNHLRDDDDGFVTVEWVLALSVDFPTA